LLRAGDIAVYERATRTIHCVSCPTAPASGQPEIDAGVAGRFGPQQAVLDDRRAVRISRDDEARRHRHTEANEASEVRALPARVRRVGGRLAVEP
jgi:hypothetical protein